MSVAPERQVHLPLGLPGFSGAREFALFDRAPDSVLVWLQSLEDPGLCLLLVEASAVHHDYPVAAVRRAIAFLELPESEPLSVFAICAAPPAPDEPTVNLLAPLAVGTTTRVGAQVVLHEAGFGLRELIQGRKAA